MRMFKKQTKKVKKEKKEEKVQAQTIEQNPAYNPDLPLKKQRDLIQ